MKTIKKLVPVIFVALIFFSCEKEKQIVKGKLPDETSNLLNALRINNNAMEDSMNAFITETRQTTPSFHNYEAQDALLVMEAALNFHTCHPDSLYDEVKTDTLAFKMSVVKNIRGEFIYSGAKMNSFWTVILDSTLHAKNRVQFDSSNNPFNVVVDLEFTNFNPVSVSDSQLVTIRVVTWVGNIVIYPIPWPCEYASSDDYCAFYSWPPFFGCNGNNNGSTWRKEMIKRLHPFCKGICDASYFSEIGDLGFSGFYGSTPAGTQTCSPDWLFWSATSNAQYCLDETQMTCFTNGAFLGALYYAPYVLGSVTEKKCVIAYYLNEHFPSCNPCPSYQWCDPLYGKPHKYVQ